MPEYTTPIAASEFELECRSSFRARRSNNFQKLLEDVQNAVNSIPLDSEVLCVTANQTDNEYANTFTIAAKIRASSWYSVEFRFDDLIPQVLSAAQIVEHSEKDTALQRYMKSHNERLVVRAGRTIAEV